MPERIKEGMALYEFRTVPRIVAGIDRKSAENAAGVFHIFPAPIHIFDSPKITEASKLFENIFRDVNIALANELALICETLQIDIMKVIEASHTDPKTHFLTPGPGVGGYCLPKDSYYLTEPAKSKGFHPKLIPLARMINDEMPSHVIKMVENALKEAGIPISGCKITILGVAFKGNSGDIRNTPVIPVVSKLRAKGSEITLFDPLVDKTEVRNLFGKDILSKSFDEAVFNAACIVVATDHIEFRKLKVSDICKKTKNLKVMVDTRNVFNRLDVKNMGIVYRGLGIGYNIH
jgi:nucleotide sugar dehydrogenase